MNDPSGPDLGAQPFTSEQRAHHLERMNSTTGVFLAGRLLINRYEATVVALEAIADAQATQLAALERLLADQDDALATQAARLAQIRTVGTRLVEALTHGAPSETFTALRLELTRCLAPPGARGAAGAREAHDGVRGRGGAGGRDSGAARGVSTA